MTFNVLNHPYKEKIMRFISPYGRHFRYNFGDKVKMVNNDSVGLLIVIDAKWIGNSKGFWSVTVEMENGGRVDMNRPHFKLVKRFYKRRMND